MRFGLITPVFNGCLESLELLYKDLMNQTYKNWVWMLCSNGFSLKLFLFVARKNLVLKITPVLTNSFQRTPDTHKLVYCHTDYEEEKDAFALLANIGKRRNFCIDQIDTDYIFMIDADAKILDKKMFQVINSKLEKNPKSACLYKIIHKAGVLPIFPIHYAKIDMLNFCVKTGLAKRVGYPTVVKYDFPGNDYWYFNRVCRASGDDYLYVDRIFAQHNGNSRYENLNNLIEREKNARK